MSDNPLFDGQGLEFHHLQRLDQRKQTREIQRLLRGVCPCPHCGGGIPRQGVAVCMHCNRELHWNEGHCAATPEDARRLANDAARKRQAARDRQAKAAAYAASPEGKADLEQQRKQKIERALRLLGRLLGVVLTFVAGPVLVIGGIGSFADQRLSIQSLLLLLCIGVAVSAVGWSLFRRHADERQKKSILICLGLVLAFFAGPALAIVPIVKGADWQIPFYFRLLLSCVGVAVSVAGWRLFKVADVSVTR